MAIFPYEATTLMFLFCSHKVNDALTPISKSFDIGRAIKLDLSAIIRKAIEIGGRHGFITFDQLNELVPPSVDSEAIEDLLEVLSDRGIDVREA